MPNIVVTNTTRRPVGLPPCEPIVKEGAIVAEGYHAQMLIPGENNVPSAHWDRIKGNPAIKQWLACEYLQNRGEGTAKSVLDSLDNVATESALKHIGKCNSVDTLKTWADGTKKRALKKAISDRVKEIVASQSGAPEGNPEPPAEDS